MNLTQAISGRRSTRDYTSEPVDEKLICRLIEAAVQAPSAMNQQPWTFTVIRDQALLERVAGHGLTLERSAIYGMQPRSRMLARLGAWWLVRRREQAMRWYNRVFMPLGVLFEKRLRLVPGLIDVRRADEVLLVLRKSSA